jgi:hypothetical protein
MGNNITIKHQCETCGSPTTQLCTDHSVGLTNVAYYFCLRCYETHNSRECSECNECGANKKCSDCGKLVCYASKHTYVHDKKWYHKKCFWGHGQDINDKALALFPHLPEDIVKCIAQTVLRLNGEDRATGKARNNLPKCKKCNQRKRNIYTRKVTCGTVGCNTSREVHKRCGDTCVQISLINAKGLMQWNEDTRQFVCWICNMRNIKKRPEK